MPRIQVQVDTARHRANYIREFREPEPVIMLTHIRDDGLADQRMRVAEATWGSTTTIEYKQTPEFGAHIFVTVYGPVRYRYQGESEWRTLEL